MHQLHLALALTLQSNLASIAHSPHRHPTVIAAKPVADAGSALNPPVGWYAGDGHGHTQTCAGSVLSIDDVMERMRSVHVDVMSLLIWHTAPQPYVNHVCAVTGSPEATSFGIVQYGIETSGLGASTFGHLIGYDIGPTEARIATASTGLGACYTATNPMGLACPGADGTGFLNYRVAQWLSANANAVFGYAHQAWPIGIYHASGYDWSGHAAAGYSLDILLLDVGQKLAFPSISSLMAGPANRNIFPLFAPVDVALGDCDFLECVDAPLDFSFGTGVPAYWWAGWEKLLSAGLRTSFSAGSDWVCRPVMASPVAPRLYTKPSGALTYSSWVQALKAGRVSMAQGDYFLGLTINGQEIGSEIAVTLPTTLALQVTVYSNVPLVDTVDIIVGGTQVASSPVNLPGGGTAVINFNLPVLKSAWGCARLRSELARTGAIYVIANAAPIVDDLTCEYWMVYCDALTKALIANPAILDCQQADALARIASARAVFKALRDLP